MKTKIADIPKDMEQVKYMNRMGGYWYLDWSFPFLHFAKERIIIATESGIYELVLEDKQ